MRANMESRLRERLADLQPVIASVGVDREKATTEVKLIRKLLAIPEWNSPEMVLESWRRRFTGAMANEPGGPKVTIVDKEGQRWSIDDSLYP
jgi:hypothetical protein